MLICTYHDVVEVPLFPGTEESGIVTVVTVAKGAVAVWLLVASELVLVNSGVVEDSGTLE